MKWIDFAKDDDELSLIHAIVKQLDLHLNSQAMKDNVYDDTTNEIKSKTEF